VARAGTVAGLYLHPIKACRGVAVDAVELDRRGIRGDRRWMIADAEGRFVSQRERPELSTVRVEVDAETMTLDAPGMTPIARPRATGDGDRVPVRIWEDACEATVDPIASEWISTFLGAPCRVVFMPDDVERPVDPGRARPGEIVGFADGFPLLVISRASLDDLNRRLDAPVPMTRFRPSIVVEGCDAYAEDGWERFRVGERAMRGVKRCARCAVTTVDPETGVKGKEPLRTLATYRSVDGKVMFGMNAIHDGGGVVRVGDPVWVEGA